MFTGQLPSDRIYLTLQELNAIGRRDADGTLTVLAVRTFFTAYRQGLNTFGIAMLDASMDDKDATTAADIAFKIFVSLAGIAFPEEAMAETLGAMATSAIKELTTGALEKGRDLTKGTTPPASRTFREFAKVLGDASVANGAAMEGAVMQGGESVKEVFGQMATAAGSTEGQAAALIGITLAASQSFTERLKKSGDPNRLEAVFATAFAGKAGQTPPTSPIAPTRDTGTLYIGIKATTFAREEKHRFLVDDETDKKWKLVTLGDQRDADGAVRALMESVVTVWKIALPRKVRIDLYEMSGGDRTILAGGWLVFNKDNAGMSPDGIEDARYPEDKKWLMLAWGDMTVRAAAVANDTLEGATQ